MRAKAKSFRVGKVAGVLRGRVWYLIYFEGGRRRRPRVGSDRDQARQMAAQINGQLEVGAPAALSYEPISVPDLRQRWLDHHEHVRRSSVATIKRYRVATEHLLTFVAKNCSIRHACEFHARQAMEFVRYLRTIKIAPTGTPRPASGRCSTRASSTFWRPAVVCSITPIGTGTSRPTPSRGHDLIPAMNAVLELI